MRKHSTRLLLSTGLVAFTAPMAMADVPRVVADIAPVHSLAAAVMEGVGAPQLLLPAEISPHGFSLRPSQAQALQDSEIVLQTGLLMPGLAGQLDSLAPDAEVINLGLVEGVTLLEAAEGHDHDHGHDDHDDHDDHADHDDHEEHSEGEDHDDHDHEEHAEGEDHDDHDHEEHAEGEDHDDHDHEEHAEGEEHDDHDDHAHDDHGHDDDMMDASADSLRGMDQHLWLDPLNAIAWLGAIAEHLSEADPENAATYQANAQATADEILALAVEIEGQFEGLDPSFVLFHDAFAYFEARFDYAALDTIALHDGELPSAGQMLELQELIAGSEGVCVLTEPQFDPGIVASLTDGLPVQVKQVDPLGAGLEPGPALYPTVLGAIAETLAECG
ncbi:MAG: zinc ABC transporter substrate-binding protein [Pseudomonadota bacterium]